MGLVKEVKIKITGQVADDYSDNDYEMVVAKLNMICAEYRLEIEEEE